MAFQNALNSWLLNNIEKANGISPNKISQNADDKFLKHQKINTNNPLSHDGPLGINTGYYQLNSYANRKIDAQNIIEEVKAKLNGFDGYIGSYRVSGIEIVTENNGFDDSTNMYMERLDLRIPYKE